MSKFLALTKGGGEEGKSLPMRKISPAVSRLLNVGRHTASLRGGILLALAVTLCCVPSLRAQSCGPNCQACQQACQNSYNACYSGVTTSYNNCVQQASNTLTICENVAASSFQTCLDNCGTSRNGSMCSQACYFTYQGDLDACEMQNDGMMSACTQGEQNGYSGCTNGRTACNAGCVSRYGST
jgi:hypothetical protein